MKNLLFSLPICLLLFSCGKTKPPALKDEWADYRKAYALQAMQKDSAFYYFNKAASVSGDSLVIAMAYNNMGVIQSDGGDYFGAQESLLASLKFLDEQNPLHRACLANDYNELGITSANLHNYEAAIDYDNKALEFTDDAGDRVNTLNNKATAYRKKKDFQHALRLYEDALLQSGKKGGRYARALTNIVMTRWLADPRYPAGPELLKALDIRRHENDLWGQNSSYAHLADYYARSMPDSALWYARSMYAVAARLNSPDDRLEALEKLVRLVPAQQVQQYFALYQALGDSLQTVRNAAKNQFAIIRYDVEKSKADNLVLQKDNTSKRYQLLVRNGLLAGLVLLSATAAVLGTIFYKRRKQRMELEAQNTVRENQLKVSKKVHDVVANGLYRMMSEIENQESFDKERLLDRIEDMYERSRDISYDEPEFAGDFHIVVSGLLTSFATETVRVVLVGNGEGLWEGVGLPARQELYYVLQELMVNMKKHSGAGNVVVMFERRDGSVSIQYADDGIGIPDLTPQKNGLTNTGNRIKAIRGTLIFDRNTGKGLQIAISFPIA